MRSDVANQAESLQKSLNRLQWISNYFNERSETSNEAKLVAHVPAESRSIQAIKERAISLQFSKVEYSGNACVIGQNFTDEDWRLYLNTSKLVSYYCAFCDNYNFYTPFTFAELMLDHPKIDRQSLVNSWTNFRGSPGNLLSNFAGHGETLYLRNSFKSISRHLEYYINSDFSCIVQSRKRFRWDRIQQDRSVRLFETNFIKHRIGDFEMQGKNADQITQWAIDQVPTHTECQRISVATGYGLSCLADLKRLMIASGLEPQYVTGEAWTPRQVLPAIEAWAANSVDPSRDPITVLNQRWAEWLLPSVGIDSVDNHSIDSQPADDDWSDWKPKQSSTRDYKVVFKTLKRSPNKHGIEIQEHPSNPQLYRSRPLNPS